jgi:DNA-binding NtrC family response regulator
MAHSILIVDDEEIIRSTLEEFLTGRGYEVLTAATAEEALEAIGRRPVDLAICDVQLPGMDGIELLDRLLKVNPECFVLVITAYATVESAVEAFKAGAHDYLMKPVLFDDLLHKIEHLFEYRQLFQENQTLRRELGRERSFDDIVGSSNAMQKIFESVRKVAQTKSNVLLIGESGTGKELIARAIHDASDERDEKFVAVNCAAIPTELLESQLFGHRRGAFTGAEHDRPGLFVAAGQGTIFLDEITELTIPVQAKLLRAIEQKEILPVGADEPISVDPRIVAATNRDVQQEVAEGRFREDLYYRLNVVSIRIPPLRERPEDVPELADFLLAKHARRLGRPVKRMADQTMRLLLAYPWKGNVRELDNALERAVIMCDGDCLTPGDLPPHIAGAAPTVPDGENLRTALRHYERFHIARMLEKCPDKKEAAVRLGLGLSSLYRKIEEFQIEA